MLYMPPTSLLDIAHFQLVLIARVRKPQLPAPDRKILQACHGLLRRVYMSKHHNRLYCVLPPCGNSERHPRIRRWQNVSDSWDSAHKTCICKSWKCRADLEGRRRGQRTRRQQRGPADPAPGLPSGYSRPGRRRKCVLKPRLSQACSHLPTGHPPALHCSSGSPGRPKPRASCLP